MAAEARRRRRETAAPLGVREARALIDQLRPFERDAHLAVAVSGGADSMALCLAAADWVRGRGGRITGVTVDHGLRRESAPEARQVGAWLAARKIPHHILKWDDQSPESPRPGSDTNGARTAANLQARARDARYRLLTDWCRKTGVLHLLTGHHRDDQAETVLLRLGRGSGVDGLAAMAPIRELADVRLLRPLLDVPHARLVATLRRRRQDWIDDPSNLDDRHARVRVRLALAALADDGVSADRLAETAKRMASARQTLEMACAQVLAAHVVVAPAGFALVDAAGLTAAPREIGLRALAQVIACVGGGAYPPRRERLTRLYDALATDAGRRGKTLGGCRIMAAPAGRFAGRVLVCREAGKAAGEIALTAGGRVLWDDRFLATCAGRHTGLRIGPLYRVGASTPRELDAAARSRLAALPGAIRPALPAILDRSGLLAVPHIGFRRDSARVEEIPEIRLAPPRPLQGPAFSRIFTVVL